MDAIDVVVAALAAGGVAGAKDVSKAAVQDAYHQLTSRLRELFDSDDRKRQLVETVIAQPEPDAVEPLAAEIAGDDRLLELAGQLLAAADPQGSRTGKYNIHIDQARGTVIGDPQHVTMTFHDE